MTFDEYLKDVNRQYVTGFAREHAYRPSLQHLIESIIPDVLPTNDPARIECGAPDFILSRRKIPVGYIEAKDIGDNLDKTEKGEQIKRYLALENLILTDYLEFRFYLNGQKVEQIRIAKVTASGKIKPIPDNFDKLQTLLVNFAAFSGQTITSAKKLAEMMARKARLMRDVFYKVVKDTGEPSLLHDQFKAFQTVLIHDMDEAQFADVYAQTVAYGLFTARLHDKTLKTFSRQEALSLIPKSNPFLRQLFHYVTGPELDDRVVWIVDALCEVYRATDLRAILKDFGTATGQNDPILHFYETFLGEYDKKLKKARGVWFTPEPVVHFIVRAIDDVLKEHFGLKDGLADTSKVKIQVGAQETDKRSKTGLELFEREVHKVQLLDVATGTGTFLAEIVKQIYSRFKGQEGLWSSYVERDLLPRLHGFELLMASYAMCHMKLDLLLQETGYKPSNPQTPPRLSVYLTNSLEEHHPEMETQFAGWLSKEANEASWIKKEMPIMVAFGNPPYSGESSNKGDWIMELIKPYKQEPGGKIKLQEKTSKWINNDYVKFLRLGEHYIEINGEGILSYITSHSYLDNITFRGMRWKLLKTFDEIYILDLHGHSEKLAPDGGPDKNVFDITEGVCIIIAVKKRTIKKVKMANLYYADVWGEREKKYTFLYDNTLETINFKKLNPVEKYYFFTPKKASLLDEYYNFISLKELFPINGVGMTTARDKFVISENGDELIKNAEEFKSSALDNTELCRKLNISNKKGWNITNSRKLLQSEDNLQQFIEDVSFRPFDNKKIFYHDALVWRTVKKVMSHFLSGPNIGLVASRQCSGNWRYIFISNNIMEFNLTGTAGRFGSGTLFPLYLYHADFGNDKLKTPNLDPKIYAEIKETIPDVTPESLFNYIYASLYSPEYRQRYNELLKSDFPRVPYPKDTNTFNALAEYGAQLREIHLMENDKLNDLITTYPVDGDHEVKKPRFEDGEVWINEKQYFGNVPEIAWEFYIGGYQPAQKWLKDRKGRKLSFEDLRHWQRIIVALSETDRIMQEIDTIDFLPKGKN